MRLSTPHGHHFFHGGSFHHSFFGSDLYGETGLHHGWLAALGIMYLLLGFIGLGMTTIFTLASVLFFGVLLLAGGIVQLGPASHPAGAATSWAGPSWAFSTCLQGW